MSNLLLGIDVVSGAVNAVPEARVGWREAAERAGAGLLHVETWPPDQIEHRRRVEARSADIPDHQVPSWDEVEGHHWVPWDAKCDGQRTLIDTSDSGRALDAILAIPTHP